MKTQPKSVVRSAMLIAMVILIAVLPACEILRPEPEPPTPTVEPTASPTPTPTSTPVPPRPVVPYTPVPADMLAPVLIQRSPKRGERLALDAAIELVFDKPMDQAAVAKALRVERAGTTDAVAGDLAWTDDRTAVFSPKASLPRDMTYDVVLTQDAKATTGEPLRHPVTFRFSTVGSLEVTQVIPGPDTADVETDALITVMFNRPVVPLTTLAEMETLPHPLSFEPELPGTGEWLNTSIYIFRPETPLSGGITYRATVSGDLTDLAGTPLSGPYTWSFGTVPPEVLDVNPWHDATLVDINTAVTARFNQPVDAQAAERAFTLRESGALGRDVRGTVDIEGRMLTFTPAQPLDFDTRYTAIVGAGVTSAAGGRGSLAAYDWQFTTVPLPRIVETFPEDGDRNARPYTDFRITFNAPIDAATVMPNLTWTPPLSVTQVHTYYSSYNQTFVINFDAQPSTDYKVEIDDGIADPYGNTIPRGRTVRFSTAQLDPTYQLRTPGFVGTYDSALPARLVVSHVNLERLNLRLFRLTPDALTKEPWQWENRDRPLPPGGLVREWRETLPDPLNEQQLSVIDLTERPAGSLEPGVYLLDIDAPGMLQDSWRRVQRHVLVVSDLNLTLKTGPDETLVWAVDLETGDPVPDLRLEVTELREGQRGVITTDGEGIARLELPDDYHDLVVVSESPFAAVGSGWGRGIGPWDFGVGEGQRAEDYLTHIYTDREIYRPGQTVSFKGVVRSDDDVAYDLPGVRSVLIEVRDINGEILLNDQATVSANGTFVGSVDLGADAALGQYVISVSLVDHHSQAYFTVAAYRPPEFEVSVAAAASEIQRGDALEATVEIAYFFGGPLADTAVSWNILAEGARFEPTWGGRYSFSDTDDPYRCFDCWWWYEPPARESLLSGSGTTDSEGRLTVRISGRELADVLPTGTQRVIFEASATGPDNQQISGRTSVTAHPGPYYIGLQARSYVSEAGKDAEIDLVATNWAGERLSGKEIKVSIFQREWVNTFVENEAGGGRWSWETKETFIEETTVTTDDLGEAVATFVPPEGGSYHIVAEPADPTRETVDIRSSIFIWVSGSDRVSWRRDNHDRITLVSDKTSYQVGETAEILIPSPLEAPQMALVTVEREGIRRYDVVRLQSNSTVYRLPIEDGDIPNIYVSVVLITPHRSGPAEFKMGLLPLAVDPAPRELDVRIETDVDQAQPGEDVTYTITALDAEGRPAAGAELSLDVVDNAVLSLKPRVSDIVDAFYAPRQLQVHTASGLSISVNRYQEELDIAELSLPDAGLGMGGGGGEMADMAAEAPAPAATQTMEGRAVEKEESIAAPPSGIEIRESFADTAAWMPELVTDRNGQATATVTLPDNLTTWVARAVGLTPATEVGESTAEVVSTKPLLIRPVTPRFFVVDDRAQLAANVSNNTTASLAVTVGLSGAGLQIASETPAEQTVTIGPRSEAKVTWWVTVDDVPQAEVVFTAQAGEFVDASRPRLTTGPDGTLLVLRYTAPDTVGTAGQLTEGGARTEAIALPPEFDDRKGQLTVHLDPSLAAAMQEGLDYLEHYEYECTEQTVSRFLPNILTYRALRDLGIENPELAEKLPALVEEGVTRLTNQQHPDGGWGWWYRAGEHRSNAYVSAYVVFALLKAQEAGFAVEPHVVQGGLSYLQSQIVGPRDLETTRDANRQAWLLYVLAEGRSADPVTIDALYGDRERLSHYARAYLAQTIWLNSPRDPRLATLLSDLNNAAILSATGTHWEETHHDWWAMNTDTRSTAIILDTYAKIDPENELIPNAVRWLMVARRVGIWETTQETAWALIALTDWMVETGELDADYDFGLYLNDIETATGTATRETVSEGVVTEIPVTDLDADQTNALTIARTDGSGRLYYTAHLQVYLPVEDLEPEDRGFIVQRRYTLASCEATDRRECPEVSEVKLGDVVRVDLTLISPHDRYYVVVEDPLPAGGEAVDAGLATTSLLAMAPSLQPEQSRYWWWWNWYSRSELRDEKVVLFADYLSAGTYEYTYTFRATMPGEYHVIPTTAEEFYFPEVFGRSDGRLFTILE